MVEVSIVNVVATAALGEKVDLDELGRLKEIFHDPDVYGGRVAYFKSPNIGGTVSIFASGKMISVGTRSEEEAIHALEHVKEFLVEKGFIKPNRLKPKIENIVVMANFGETMDLEELA